MQHDRRLFPGPIPPDRFSHDSNLRPDAFVRAESLALLAKEVDAMKETHRRMAAREPQNGAVKLT